MRPSVCFLVLASVVALSTAARAETPPSFLFKWKYPSPAAVAVDAGGNVYVSDGTKITKHTAEGAFLASWGSGGSGDGEFSVITGIAVDGSGNVYVVERGNNRIQKFSGPGAFVTKWGTLGARDGEFLDPAGVAVDASGNVYVADMNNFRIQKFDGNGTFLSKWGIRGTGDGEFDRAQGVAVDGSGNVYVTDNNNRRIQKFTSAGSFLGKWGSFGTADGQFDVIVGLAVDASGSVYVTDNILPESRSGSYVDMRVQKFDGAGTLLARWGSLGTGDGQFSLIGDIAVSGSGLIYVADGFGRIQVFGTPQEVPPEEQVAALGDAVQALVTGGALLPSQGNSLLTKLDAGLSLLSNGNTQGAISKLGDFIKQVSSFIKTGKLTLKQGQPLIDAANALIADLQAPSSPSSQPMAAIAHRSPAGGREAAVAVPGALRVHPGTLEGNSGRLTLVFDVPSRSDVTVDLYDVAGRRIEGVRLGLVGPGQQEWRSAPLHCPSGLLFYRVMAGGSVVNGKVAFLN